MIKGKAKENFIIIITLYIKVCLKIILNMDMVQLFMKTVMFIKETSKMVKKKDSDKYSTQVEQNTKGTFKMISSTDTVNLLLLLAKHTKETSKTTVSKVTEFSHTKSQTKRNQFTTLVNGISVKNTITVK